VSFFSFDLGEKRHVHVRRERNVQLSLFIVLSPLSFVVKRQWTTASAALGPAAASGPRPEMLLG